MDRNQVVLLVDDDAGLREIISILLQTTGFGVLQAANGVEALELLKSVKPDLILLDLSMPVMDGFEFRQLQLRDPATAAIPVIVLTGSSATEQVLEMKVSAVLKKPVTPGQLIGEITNCHLL
jgi:CheY-like chemotaxis protein